MQFGIIAVTLQPKRNRCFRHLFLADKHIINTYINEREQESSFGDSQEEGLQEGRQV